MPIKKVKGGYKWGDSAFSLGLNCQGILDGCRLDQLARGCKAGSGSIRLWVQEEKE